MKIRHTSIRTAIVSETGKSNCSVTTSYGLESDRIATSGDVPNVSTVTGSHIIIWMRNKIFKAGVKSYNLKHPLLLLLSD